MTSKIAKTSNAKFEVEKFNGKINFSLWKVQVKDILIQQGLHKALKGPTGKPADMKDEDWENLDLQACSTIRLCLEKEIMYNVMRETSAVSLWEKLETLYMAKSLTSKLYLKRQLYSFRMKEGVTINEHLCEFNKITIDLLNAGVIVNEEDKTLLFLCSLPPTYEHLVITLLHGKDTVKFDDVTSTLLSDEYRKKDVERPAEGLFVRGKTKERKFGSKFRSKSRPRGDLECFWCHEKGHMKRDCLKYKASEKKEGNEAAVVTEVASDDSGDVLAVTTYEYTANSWILDSGCSYHMCPNRDWFTTYNDVNGGTVLMGNDHACEIVGVGTVRIKMHDGVVRTLTGVRHIPDLRKNLISLGSLDSNGCQMDSGRWSS